MYPQASFMLCYNAFDAMNRSSYFYLPQHFLLYDISMNWILCINRPGAAEEVRAAAASANAHVVMNSLPEGYNTHRGERGIPLSAWHRQRIAVARAVLMNPRVRLQ
jgi:ATP-binding cassette subfamily B protein